MSLELWGTFSVRDHLEHRAFIADVLLYDQLVIPTLPKNEPETEWPPEWNIKKQKTLLADLGDLVIPIPWTADRRTQWQARFDSGLPEERRLTRGEATQTVAKDVKAARDQEADAPFKITRDLLQDFVNNDADDELFKKLRATRKVRPGSTLEAVSAYPSYDTFADHVSVVAAAPKTEEPHRLAPTKVFGWEFFIPDSAESGEDADRKLLEQAKKLAIRSDFVELRGEFYKWWSDVSDSGMSAEELRMDMEKRIADYHKIIKGQGWKTATRYAIKVADAFSGGLGLVNEVASASAEAFLGSADVFADARLKREKAPPRLKVAAIFHDARAKFGFKTPK